MPDILSASPKMILHPGFILPEELQSLIDLGKTHEQPTKVVDQLTGEGVSMSYRTGMYAFLPDKEPVVKAILDRIVELTNVKPSQLEGLQVLRYGVGDEYLPHDDIFHPNVQGSQKPLRQGGQRILSFIACLKEADEGGALYFPRIDKTIHLKAGELVLFWNLNDNGSYCENAQHAARAVIRGEKISLVGWIRERAFDGSEEKVPAPTEPQLAKMIYSAKEEREKACAQAVELALTHFRCLLKNTSVPQIDRKTGLLKIEPTFKIIAR